MNLTFTWLRFWCTERAGFHEKTTTEWEETGGKCTGNSEGMKNDMLKPLLKICLFAISQPIYFEFWNCVQEISAKIVIVTFHTANLTLKKVTGNKLMVECSMKFFQIINKSLKTYVSLDFKLTEWTRCFWPQNGSKTSSVSFPTLL